MQSNPTTVIFSSQTPIEFLLVLDLTDYAVYRDPLRFLHQFDRFTRRGCTKAHCGCSGIECFGGALPSAREGLGPNCAPKCRRRRGLGSAGQITNARVRQTVGRDEIAFVLFRTSEWGLFYRALAQRSLSLRSDHGRSTAWVCTILSS